MRQRIVRRKHRKSHGRGHRLIQLARIAQRAHQAVMRLNMRRVFGNGGAKGLCRFGGTALGQQILCALGQRVGDGEVGHGWL